MADRRGWDKTDLNSLYSAAKSSMNGTRLEQEIVASRTKVNLIVEDVQQAAGVVADGELASAFNDYQKTEIKSANYFRGAAIGLLVAVMAFSIYSATKLPPSLGSSLAHLGIAVSGLAAFAYLARESAQHRNAGRWAAIMSVQLKTLSAYSADMTVAEREELRGVFGRRVFSELPSSSKEPQQGLTDIAPTLQALIDVIKSVRGGG
ncbi:hypothetical protein F1D05_22590 [Kribbella qitaiheensis]|uniref:DUF4231 domain-containing protein n=1 Tax=Kribbella qitaiheensis TaxID=1544730 RepID=A0A7G6X1S1_9ACTN|nr:hypothetical protein [Kribbella qitaiheensis]QNE20186.1 hypothetical protein F1D05_22590 [Kribbella qitaiheensis]